MSHLVSSNLVSRLNASRHLKATMTACSLQAGWRSLLLRAYVDPPEAEITTPPTTDQLIVLVTGGACEIEGRYDRRWQRASYGTGCLGMTAPGQQVTLRWRGDTSHSTLQLHIPATTIHEMARELPGGSARLGRLPSQLLGDDPVVRQVMLGLSETMATGAPDLYAETAGDFLATHLLLRCGDTRTPPVPRADDARLSRVDAYMRENLGAPLSLKAMAEEACISRFHFLRLFKQVYGETPLKRLTRLRMEEAQRRLARGREPITEIAFACGYENPAHFASAFRRAFGVAPSAYRKLAR